MQQDYTEERVQVMNDELLIRNMVVNQNVLNCRAYNADWVAKGNSKEFDYPLAAAQEIGEFINSYGYSWWSKPAGNLATAPVDASNCRTEIVDAVHFMLSQSIIDEGIDGAVASIQAALTSGRLAHTQHDTRTWARWLSARLMLCCDVENVARGGTPAAWIALFAVSESMGFDLQALHARYMGKSALNAFRQKHGYKEGRYKKLWDGKNEDNYFLAQWIDGSDTAPSYKEVELWLEEQYAAHTAEQVS